MTELQKDLWNLITTPTLTYPLQQIYHDLLNLPPNPQLYRAYPEFAVVLALEYYSSVPEQERSWTLPTENDKVFLECLLTLIDEHDIDPNYNTGNHNIRLYRNKTLVSILTNEAPSQLLEKVLWLWYAKMDPRQSRINLVGDWIAPIDEAFKNRRYDNALVLLYFLSPLPQEERIEHFFQFLSTSSTLKPCELECLRAIGFLMDGKPGPLANFLRQELRPFVILGPNLKRSSIVEIRKMLSQEHVTRADVCNYLFDNNITLDHLTWNKHWRLSH